MSSVPQQISVQRDRCLKRINASTAGVAYSGPAYDSLSSKDVTEVEYATEWYSESPGRPLLSPATKKRYRDQAEANMSEMSSMSVAGQAGAAREVAAVVVGGGADVVEALLDVVVGGLVVFS